MEKGQIIWKDSSPYPELQRYFIEEAENNTDEYLKKYKNFKASANGHYINADLMKETFDVYASSPANRKAYNLTIHNSAAVLSNELFKQMLETESIKNCIFLTGAPGAGKTFLSQSLFLTNMVSEDTIIYEVNIASPSIFNKIDLAQQNGVESSIIVVNSPLKLSAENAVRREIRIGREVTPFMMAKLYSEIPDYLLQIHKKYPDLDLGIFDKKDNYNADYLLGFDNLEVLNYGEFESIQEKISKLMEYYRLRLSKEEVLTESEEYEI